MTLAAVARRALRVSSTKASAGRRSAVPSGCSRAISPVTNFMAETTSAGVIPFGKDQPAGMAMRSATHHGVPGRGGSGVPMTQARPSPAKAKRNGCKRTAGAVRPQRVSSAKGSSMRAGGWNSTAGTSVQATGATWSAGSAAAGGRTRRNSARGCQGPSGRRAVGSVRPRGMRRPESSAVKRVKAGSRSHSALAGPRTQRCPPASQASCPGSVRQRPSQGMSDAARTATDCPA